MPQILDDLSTPALIFAIKQNLYDLFDFLRKWDKTDFFSDQKLKRWWTATAAVFYSAGVAGIQMVATLSEWRGKGIGAAATLAPLLDAREMGYRVGILQSSEMGLKVYQRLGFKELCRMRHYAWLGR